MLQSLFNQGTQLQKSGNIEQAVIKFQEALTLDSEHSPTHHKLAEIYERLNFPDKAIVHQRKIVALESDNYYAMAKLAHLLVKTANFSAASDIFQNIIFIKPNYPNKFYKHLYCGLANCFIQTNELNEAINCYQKAIELEPKDHLVYRAVGKLYVRKSYVDEAISCYQKAIDFQPSQPLWVYIDLGSALEEKGQIDDAIAVYQKGATFNSEHSERFYLNLARLYAARSNSNINSEGIQLPLASTKYVTKTGIYYLPTSAKSDVVARDIKSDKVFQGYLVKKILKFCRKGSTILDVGANYGQMSLQFSQAVGSSGKIYSFEASPLVYEFLVQNLKANGADNIIPVFGAVSDIVGQRLFFPYPNLSQEPTFGSYGINPSSNEGFSVTTLTIDSLNIQEKIDFMKIDIQGADLACLKGAVKTIQRSQMPIVLEYESKYSCLFNETYQDYLDFVTSISYSIEEGPKSTADLPEKGTVNLLIIPRQKVDLSPSLDSSSPSTIEAKSISDILLLKSHNDPSNLLNTGKLALAEEQFDAADCLLTRAIELNPSLAETYFQRATLNLIKDNCEEALSDCNSALEIDSSLIKAKFLKLRIQKYTNALKLAETEIKLVKFLCDQSKISLDIGAAWGLYSLEILNYSNSCICFEPRKHAIDNLISSCHEFGDLKYENVALSDADGITQMRIPKYSPGWGTIETDNQLVMKSHEGIELIEVNIKRIDSYDFEDIGFIKIDVEGHEVSVLKGGLETISKYLPNMIVELYDKHNPGVVNGFFEIAKQLGYKGLFFDRDEIKNLEHFDLEEHQLQRQIQDSCFNFIFIHESNYFDVCSRIHRLYKINF